MPISALASPSSLQHGVGDRDWNSEFPGPESPPASCPCPPSLLPAPHGREKQTETKNRETQISYTCHWSLSSFTADSSSRHRARRWDISEVRLSNVRFVTSAWRSSCRTLAPEASASSCCGKGAKRQRSGFKGCRVQGFRVEGSDFILPD